MSAQIGRIYRHPVKSLGEEARDEVTLSAGCTMPWDRAWAVTHGASAFDPGAPEWVKPTNFVTQTFVPALSQIGAAYDEGSGQLTLTHPARPEITLAPGTPDGAAALTDWLLPLAEDVRPGPYGLARLPGGAFTDDPDTHIAINSLASLRALEAAAGRPLAHIRFRGNFWLDGLDPWQEFEWVGQEISLGAARLEIIEPIVRCNATAANPETGQRDLPLPNLLEERYGHRDFGVYAQVIEGGPVRLGDPVTVP